MNNRNLDDLIKILQSQTQKPTKLDEREIITSLLNGLRPEQDITVSEWADQNRILSSVSSAEPGQWRTDRFPFLREVMDKLSANDPTETVVVQKGAQLGFTEAGNNWIGYIIHHAPGPTLIIWPTGQTAEENSKLRIDPLISESPALRDRVKEPKAKESGNTKMLKEFPGGFLNIAGSNSPAPLRSKPVRFLFLDEVDSYPGDVGEEGDPVSLAKARTRTFSRRKIFMISTPTIKKRSRIESAFLETDQRRYFVPCPHCNFMQHLEWKNIKWVNKDPRTAHYECSNCSKKIYNHDKNYMLSRGEWRPTARSTETRLVGYHISSLYSPVGFYSWEDAVSEWLAAQKEPRKLKTFINTVLGESFEEKGDAPEWEKLYYRRESYPIGIIPEGGLCLVAGADIQRDRIEVEVVAYGRNKISWSIEYLVFPGDPSQPEIWNNLDELLGKTYITKNGHGMQILGMAIDSGHETAHVYNYARKKPKNRVFAVKGQDSLKQIFSNVKILDIRLKDGKRIPNGARLWNIGVSTIKSELYDFLAQDKPDQGSRIPYGYCFFPEYSEEFFKQLVSEELVSHHKKNGTTNFEWKKIRDRNEALDCRVYARAAAAIIGMDRWAESVWQKLEEEYGRASESRKIDDPEIKKPAQKTRAGVKRIFSRGVVS